MKLTQEQLAALIAKVISNITSQHEAARAAGQDVADEITAEEIATELANVLADEDVATDATDEAAAADTAADEGKGDGCEVSPELVAAVIAALGAQAETKAADAPAAKETKAGGPAAAQAAAPAQRKYANIFLAGSSDRDGANRSEFKSRLAAMPEAQRRKTVYGAFGRAVKCIHAASGDVERSAFYAEKRFGDAEMAREFKALSATVPGDGGYLVPEVYANEIIELLYPATVIYALGARRLGMANGNLNIPKVKTGTRAMFTGENRPIAKSAPQFGNLKLSAKKLTALIPMSNDLLRSTNFDNDVIVGQDVTRQMALGVDYGALLGTGGEFQPLGIMHNKGVQNIDVSKIDALYAKDGVLTSAFPNYLIAAVLKNNAYADGLGFVFNTSVEQFFKSLRDEVGGFLFAKEMSENGTLAGYPYRATNLLETTPAGKTSIIFGNWNDLVIGEQGALEIETSREGSWTDESGKLVSAFENDQTLIRAINNVDAGLRHDESFAVATNVSVPM